MTQPQQQFVPDGSVIITPRQMYDQIGALTDEVRGLRATVDPALSEVRADAKEALTAANDLGKENVRLNLRLTVIETKFKIAWALFTVTFSGLGGLVALWVSHRGGQ